MANAAGGAGEFVPEGRLSLRQVVHGLCNGGGRALPGMMASARGDTHGDGSDVPGAHALFKQSPPPGTS